MQPNAAARAVMSCSAYQRILRIAKSSPEAERRMFGPVNPTAETGKAPVFNNTSTEEYSL